MTFEAGVHRIAGVLLVPEGRRLTLKPGAILSFDPGASLRVRGGVLQSLGDEEHPVVLRSDGPGAWGGLRIEAKGEGVLVHTAIESAGADAAITLTDASLDATHLTLARPVGAGIAARRSKIRLRDSTFPAFGPHEVIHGVGLEDQGLLIQRCTFRPVEGFHDVIDFERCGPSGVHVELIQDTARDTIVSPPGSRPERAPSCA